MALAMQQLHHAAARISPCHVGWLDPAGRTIFVHTEQGYGDTIQFVRYVPMLAAGQKWFWMRTQPLTALLVNVQGVARVVPAGMRPPDFDLHIPLLSLPRIFGTTLATCRIRCRTWLFPPTDWRRGKPDQLLPAEA